MVAHALSDEKAKAEWLARHYITKLSPAPAPGIDWRLSATTICPSGKFPAVDEEYAVALDAAYGSPQVSTRGLRKEHETSEPYWAINPPAIREDVKAAQSGDKDAAERLIAEYNTCQEPTASDQLTRKAAKNAILSYDLESPHTETLFQWMSWDISSAITERRFGRRLDIAHYRGETYAEFSCASRAAVGADLTYIGKISDAREDHVEAVWYRLEDRHTRIPFDFWPDRAREYVADLPERDRAIILGLYRDGLLVSEIAEDLGISAPAVTKRIPFLKGDLVSRFGLLVFHDQAPIAPPRRLAPRARKKTGTRKK